MRMVFLFIFSIVAADSLAQAPNIIYIMSDDHDADAISAYNKRFITTPNIDRIAKEGMRFTNAFVGNSVCSPSRATLLTGQHSHKNGVRDNTTRFDPSKMTLPKLLQQAGYQTFLSGKWHLHSSPTGFDKWKILPGQGIYYNPPMFNMDGTIAREQGYVTDIITDIAISWIKSRDPQKPFLLMLHNKAPHSNFSPKLKYLQINCQKIFPEPSTLYADMNHHSQAWQILRMYILQDMRLCIDLKIDPFYLMDIPELRPDSNTIAEYKELFASIPKEDQAAMAAIYAERGKMVRQIYKDKKLLLKYKYQWYIQDYMSCIASVDENVGKLLDFLDRNNLAKNTLIIYTSDQGFYLGENGWFDKRFMYDVSMNTPFLVRWPGKIKPGSVNTALIQNIDNAPTMLDAAGISVPASMQGLSLVPILTHNKLQLPRKSLYYHYYEYPIDSAVITKKGVMKGVLPHLGIRNKRYKLIYFYTIGEWELYDLKLDPGEHVNLIHNDAYKNTLLNMRQELINLRKFYDDTEPAGELN
jgi:arylsulfatase A-like enzyme